jgi:HlyD family secretion protein
MQLPLVGKVKRPLPWLIGLLAAGVLGASAIAFTVFRTQNTPLNIADLTVPVEAQAVTLRITASGTVQPVQSVNVSPKATGRLAELYVEQGDRVVQGQVIARMENDDLQSDVRQAQAAVAQAQARVAQARSGSRPQEIRQAEASVEQAQSQVAAAQSRLDLAQSRLSRNQFLAAEGAISQDDLDAARNEADNARASLEQARAGLREAQSRLGLVQSGSRQEEIQIAEAQLAEAQARQQAAEVRLEDTIVRAPFDGIVTQKYATAGAFVAPATSASEATSATSTAIVAIAQGLEILAEVPEEDISQIRPGQLVEIIADAYPDQRFEGRVRLVAPEAIVRQTVTLFQVRVDLLTGQDQLRSGMNVDVTFLGDQVDDALMVPTVAIVTQNGETGVLVPNADNTRIRFQQVVVGQSVDGETQVLDGLEAGDRVFVDLPPGQSLENLNFGTGQTRNSDENRESTDE